MKFDLLKTLNNKEGAALVEFALIIPLLLTIFFGIVELGLLFYNQQVITNASREGARAAVVMRQPRVPDSEIQNIVIDFAENFMVSFGPSSTLTTTITPDETTRAAAPFGTELVVSVTYPFEFMALPTFGTGPITLRAETRMRME